MRHFIWRSLKSIPMSGIMRQDMFLLINTLVFLLIGGFFWEVAGRFFLPHMEWLVCFAGYGAVWGFLIGLVFLCKNDYDV